jgi:restriction endonuclease Mrr
MEENNKSIVPNIRVNITASRVRVKLFNLVRNIFVGKSKQGEEEFQCTDQVNILIRNNHIML